MTSNSPDSPGIDREESPAPFRAAQRQVERLVEEQESLQSQYENLQRDHVDMVRRYSWALACATELSRCPRGLLGFLAQLLPHGLWRWHQARRLRRLGLFNVRAYRRRYPDTRRSRFGPLSHFFRWGVKEGRMGGPNQAPGSVPPPSPETIAAILRSGLFDADWYRGQYGCTAPTDEAAVCDYLAESELDPLRNPGPLFSGAFYIMQNPDTAGINPLQHYLAFGMAEGRRAFAPAAADAYMEGAADQALKRLDELLDPTRPVLILTWRDGNFFFADIAAYLCEYLARRGYTARQACDDAGVESDQNNLVVVAPHEYCIHGPGRAWPAERLGQVVYVNTEQWHTSWFSLALGVMAHSAKVLDINPASARGLGRLGLQAGFLPIVPAEGETFSFARAPLSSQTAALRAVKPLTYPTAFAERPYDILYVAALNERRARILADLAPDLARHDCFLHTPMLQGPVNSRSANMIPSADFSQLARNAKILLNIHQGESRYFEWHRLFVSGICEGCVVVTEPCIDTGVLIAGTHYLEIEAGLMGQYVNWLLSSPQGRLKLAEIHDNCAGFRTGQVAIEQAAR